MHVWLHELFTYLSARIEPGSLSTMLPTLINVAVRKYFLIDDLDVDVDSCCIHDAWGHLTTPSLPVHTCCRCVSPAKFHLTWLICNCNVVLVPCEIIPLAILMIPLVPWSDSYVLHGPANGVCHILLPIALFNFWLIVLQWDRSQF